MDVKGFQNYNIIVCGTGATGSQLIPFLTQLVSYEDSCTLTFIDGDKVETKNLRNQKFLKADDGFPKARVLQRRYSKIYPNLPIQFIEKYIKEADDIMKCLSTNENTLNIILGCVDNNPTRKILGEVFNEHTSNIMYVDSGNGTDNMQGQIVVAYKDIAAMMLRNSGGNAIAERIFTDVKSPCASQLFEDIMEDTDTVDHVTSCSYVGDKNPQNIATNIMAASTVFSIINQAIKFNNIQTGVTYFDAMNQTIVHRPMLYDTSHYEEIEVEMEVCIREAEDRVDNFAIDRVSCNINDGFILFNELEVPTTATIEFPLYGQGYSEQNNVFYVSAAAPRCEIIFENNRRVECDTNYIKEHLFKLTPYNMIIGANNDDGIVIMYSPVLDRFRFISEERLLEITDIAETVLDQYDEADHIVRFDKEGRIMG